MRKIAIFGVPRSGTSWISQIFNSHPDVVLRFQPLFSFEHKGRLTDHSTREEINRFFDEIMHSQDPFALMNSDMHRSYPVFNKSQEPTHIVFKETRYLHVIETMLEQCSDIKVIGIVRNPLATLASWIRAPKEFNPEWDVHQEWRAAPSKNQGKPEEFYGFDKWKNMAENFLRFDKIYPNQFKIVRYDQLNASPMQTTAEIFKFCGLGMHPQVMGFITKSQSLHDKDPYSVFRSNASDDRWYDILPVNIVQEIKSELHNTPMQSFLAERT